MPDTTRTCPNCDTRITLVDVHRGETESPTQGRPFPIGRADYAIVVVACPQCAIVFKINKVRASV
jgi:hypothetical protein